VPRALEVHVVLDNLVDDPDLTPYLDYLQTR
jgi:hypothetical protein